MSLSLARVWVTSTIRQPQAKSEALRLLDQAAKENVDATLIVGAELSTTGRCYLGRWDGRELTVIELAEEQQRDWKINRLGLFSQLEPARDDVGARSDEPPVSLSILSVDGAGDHDGWQPLSGSCLAELDQVPLHPIGNCALRAEYFRPDLARSVTCYWYLNSDLASRRTELKFRLPPLFTENNAQCGRGPLAVFLQLVSAENWEARTECRRFSNVAAVIVTLR